MDACLRAALSEVKTCERWAFARHLRLKRSLESGCPWKSGRRQGTTERCCSQRKRHVTAKGENPKKSLVSFPEPPAFRRGEQSVSSAWRLGCLVMIVKTVLTAKKKHWFICRNNPDMDLKYATLIGHRWEDILLPESVPIHDLTIHLCIDTAYPRMQKMVAKYG